MNKRKNFGFIVFFILIFGKFLMAQNEPADSLLISIQDAWKRADENSKELQLKHVETLVGEEHVSDAKRNWLPQIEAEAKYGKLTNIPIFVDGILNDAEYIPLEDHSTYDVGVEAYFNLYNGKKVKIAVDKAEEKASMLKYIEDASTSQVHYEVARNYLDILRSNEFELIIAQNINRNAKVLDQITQLYDNGVVLKSDVLRAQLQLSQQNSLIPVY